jgi:hypothetical protein
MRLDDAPPVTYPVGRTPRLAWLLAGLWLAGAAAVLGAWMSAPSLRGWEAVGLIASVAVGAVACLAFWRSQRARKLMWDGERWSLQPASETVDELARPQVRMDFQRAMLLNLAPSGSRRPVWRPIWLWAEAALDPAGWHLLRCALYSSVLSVAAEPLADEAV